MREYLYREVSDFNTQEAFTKLLNELAKDGWILQEFHPTTFISTLKICAVFYRDR